MNIKRHFGSGAHLFTQFRIKSKLGLRRIVGNREIIAVASAHTNRPIITRGHAEVFAALAPVRDFDGLYGRSFFDDATRIVFNSHWNAAVDEGDISGAYWAAMKGGNHRDSGTPASFVVRGPRP